MADIKQTDPQQGAAEALRNRGRAAVAEGVAATLGATQGAANAAQGTRQASERGSEQAVQQGGEAVREGTGNAAEVMRRSAEAGRRGGEAMAETARHGVRIAAEGQQNVMQHAAEEMEQTGRGLAAIAEEAAQGLRHFMAVPGSRGMQDTHQALQQLVDGVISTNFRMAQELMRRNGPSAFIDLQRNFLREYFDALAEGGTVLLRAARQATDETLRPLEREVAQRRQGNRGGEQHRDHHAGRVADVMSTDVKVVGPDETVQQAARMMTAEDAGVLPVREGDRLIGMLTDRDLAVRLAAEGKDPTRTKVREVMSPEVRYVYEDETLDHVADNMAEQKLRRMPVMNRQKRLVGIISLGDIAGSENGHGHAARAVSGVSQPGGQHNQHQPANA
jgi:CBS domain-containing protein